MRPAKWMAAEMQDVPLGPDAKVRLEVVADPKGTRISVRIWRCSPNDRSPERFCPTGACVEVPVAAYKPFLEAFTRVGLAASEHEFWRPYPHDKDAA
ncbi:MAG TPA: hypothetical protein PKA66_07395 [Gemmatimonadales bacterium]|nr:hypothetical protein [Gemmatimonadales bacterium]